MKRIEWNITYSVNIRSVDSQHRALFDLVNRFGDSLAKGQARELLSEILTELIEYTQYHFAHEEEMFRQFGYTHQENHELEHKKLTERVVAFKKRFEAGESDDPEVVMAFLIDWLKTHILVSDKAYAKELVARGAK